MRLCVIGYGASAASLIEEILERCEASAQTASASGLTSITVIEAKPSQLGLGLAYAQQPERLLLNQPADRMSLTTDRADFLRWARQHWDQHVDAGDCLPRYVFGNYMNWRRALTVPRAAKLGISLRTHVGAATEVTRKGRLWRVTCSTGVNTVAEYVVLATGHNPPQTFQSLEGADGYIADPLQFDSIVERAKGNRVGILGTSLTAIDVARVLLRDGSATSISMISRNGMLPPVKTRYPKTQLSALTTAALRELRQRRPQPPRVRDILRLLRRDLMRVGYQWQDVFRTSKFLEFEDADYLKYLQSQITDGDKDNDLKALLEATNSVIEEAWHHLSPAQKSLYMERFHSPWMATRVTIPKEPLQELQDGIAAGALSIHPGVKDVFQTPDTGAFKASFVSGADLTMGVVVNATGPQRVFTDPGALPPPYAQMVRDGHAQNNPHGGVSVAFETNEVLSKAGRPQSGLFCLGEMTSGTFYYVNSLILNRQKAVRIARDILTPAIRSDAISEKMRACV